MTHQQNTPRTHNAAGERVDEPVQCEQCLQAWPCEVARLQQQIDDMLHWAEVAKAKFATQARPSQFDVVGALEAILYARRPVALTDADIRRGQEIEREITGGAS